MRISTCLACGNVRGLSYFIAKPKEEVLLAFN